jgi:hypothetical protein
VRDILLLLLLLLGRWRLLLEHQSRAVDFHVQRRVGMPKRFPQEFCEVRASSIAANASLTFAIAA